MKTTMEEKLTGTNKNRNNLRFNFRSYVIITTFVIIGLIFGFKRQPGEMGIVFAFSVLLIVLKHPDIFAEFSVGPRGLKLKLRELEANIESLQKVLCALSRATLAGIINAGRTGGTPDDIQKQVIYQLVDALKGMKVDNPMLEAVFTELGEYTLFDYAHYILGGNSSPSDTEVRNDLKNLRSGGRKSPPSPDEIEKFLTQYDLFTDERRELVEDYRYFCQHSKHRRPEVWADRTHWPRLWS